MGTVKVLREALGADIDVGERVTDGAPLGSYRRGRGWFFGVYFNGFTGMSSTHYEVTYSLGLDITRIAPEVPTGKQGEWFLKDGELWDMVGRTSQLMLAAQGKVAVACNAALAGTWEDGRGAFREQFHTCNVGKGRAESPEWVLGVQGENNRSAVVVVPLTFNGLKWRKLLSENWTGGA